MREGIVGLLASGAGLLVFVVLLIYAVVKTKKILIAVSAVALLLMLASGVWAALRLGRESRKRVEKIMETRSGNEIYFALFGDSDTDCVQVLNHQDQTLPVIDFAIYLEGKTCPPEVARIAKQRSYEVRKDAGSTYGSVDNLSWFTPSVLGDSIWVWSQFDEFGNGREIYLSEDSTHFFCRDVMN